MTNAVSTLETRYAELTPEMLQGRTVHPVAACFPMLDVDTFVELADSIDRFGLIDPIIVDGATILDGRNRLAACFRAKVEPRFKQYEGTVPVANWILTQGLMRRSLTEDQRVAISMAAMKIMKAEREANKAAKQFKAGNPGGPGGVRRSDKAKSTVRQNSGEPLNGRDFQAEHANSSAGALATAAGVSRYKAEQALAVLKIDEDHPGTLDAVIQGKLKLRNAVKTSKPKPEYNWETIVNNAWKRLFRKLAAADHAKARKVLGKLIAKEGT